MKILFLGTSSGWPLPRLGLFLSSTLLTLLEKFVKEQGGSKSGIAFDGLEIKV